MVVWLIWLAEFQRRILLLHILIGPAPGARLKHGSMPWLLIPPRNPVDHLDRMPCHKSNANSLLLCSQKLFELKVEQFKFNFHFCHSLGPFLSRALEGLVTHDTVESRSVSIHLFFSAPELYFNFPHSPPSPSQIVILFCSLRQKHLLLWSISFNETIFWCRRLPTNRFQEKKKYRMNM